MREGNGQEAFVASKQDIQQLMSTLTHDLCNPLVNMQALMHDIRTALDEPSTVDKPASRDVAESLDMMETTVASMNRLILGVNDIYHGMFDEPEYASVDMLKLVQRAVERRHDMREKLKVSIYMKIDHVFWADPLAMHGVIDALLENAFQALAYDGHISIKTERRGDLDVLVVRDSGCGMNEHDLKRIFQPFFSLKTGKAGIGLALVKAWVQAQGGKVWCESRIDVGSIFYVGVPVKPE